MIDKRGLEEISIGDYVLSGGEIAAMALIDVCVRLIPGVLGAAASLAEESFSHELLEYPQYTRPQVFRGHGYPERADFRRPRKDRGLAKGAGGSADQGPPAGPVGRPCGPPAAAQRKQIEKVTKPPT